MHYDLRERLYAPQQFEAHTSRQHNEDFSRALKAQSARGFGALWFRAQLEPAFREYLAQSGHKTRTVLFVSVFIIALLLPSFSIHLLNEPAALASYSRWLIYAQLPPILAGALMAWSRPLSRYVELLCIVVFAYGVAVVLLLRSMGQTYEFAMPLEWIGLSITALLLGARLRFWLTMPWVLLAMVATFLNEWLFVASEPSDYYAVTALSLLVIIVCIGGYSLEYFIRRTWINSCLLNYISYRDGLTDLLNRRALNHATSHMIAHARRQHCAFAIAMIDIDYFKDYNDHYGHRAGDAVLCQVADILYNAARRPQDFCGRYGGEEFVLAWVDSDYEGSRQLANTLRTQVEQAGLQHAGSKVSDSVTISIGLYSVHPKAIPALAHKMEKASDESIALLFDAADELLYQAKTSGRNQVASGALVMGNL